MDFSEQYRKLSVKVTCKDIFIGSGCLFQADSDEYTYVITAKHCLEGEDFSYEFIEDLTVNTDDVYKFNINDIKVERFNDNREWTSYAVKNYFSHNSLDLAVLLVEKYCDFDSPMIDECRGNDELIISGFPSEMEEILENPKENIQCRFIETTIDGIYVKTNVPLVKKDEKTDKLIDYADGLSGSGIYRESEESLFLIGIFTGFKDERLSYDELEAIKINLVNEILENYSLPLLYNPKLTSFSVHVDNAYKATPIKIAYELKKFSNSIQDISPLDIISILGSRIFFPYGKENLLNDKLWSSWLKVITYLNIYYEVSIDREEFKNYVSAPQCKFKHYYCTKYDRLEQIVKAMYKTIYNDLNKEGCILISTNEVPDKKYLKKERVSRILPDIADELLEQGIDIYNPQTRKNLSCVHINYFQQILSDNDYDCIDDSNQRQREIKQCIKEVVVSVAD
ncbi:hypothetical protein CDLVIII_2408 [Clostridium sp. DL-VIII]|uniref:ABC-three component system protein n=1 Tax=Clostridium sp. DL-VIII TaxID=641107 RepID=UPI00023AFE87|nr:ABC-three component system protein [Clostridium sp. DL-VIII]EHI99054.1 hypothetical protein CDLVIII_2408 [Clostridium sp. DL-VIII]